MFLMLASLVEYVPESFAGIYEYTDVDGVIHFTDDPSNIPKNIRSTIITSVEPSPSSIEAKPVPDKYEKFFKSKFSDLEEPKDPRLSTPEGAIMLFKHGLISGNLDDIKASVTIDYWKLVDGFKGISKEQLKKESAWIPDKYSLKKVNSYYAIVEFKEGLIKMVNLYGNWKLFFDFR
jgi:hypothetical protein